MKESQIAVMEEFVVLAGSTVNEKTSTKSLSSGEVKLREKIFEDGKLDRAIRKEGNSGSI